MSPEDKPMLKTPDYLTAQTLLLATVTPVDTEQVSLSSAQGRILAADVIAAESVPSFDRSPYDGYACRAADTAAASKHHPVTLRILEEVPAGAVPSIPVTAHTAVKILTGAPLPEGADAIVKYELTEFTKETVTLFSPLHSGENIVRAGEDVRRGDVLARCGTRLDPGLSGLLASQGITEPLVYRTPKVGILSIGNEVVDAEHVPAAGTIRDSNRYTLENAIRSLGCETVYLGIAKDSAEDLRDRILSALSCCDAIVSTGGVSVGDYDRMPEAMELAGTNLLFRGTAMKPGMACAYGICQGKPICALSGNPASSFTNFCVIALPALKKLMGHADPLPIPIRVTLSGGFRKPSPTARFLRGKLELADGHARMTISRSQGNAVLSSTIGCNVMALIPAGSGPIPSGTDLSAFLL